MMVLNTPLHKVKPAGPVKMWKYAIPLCLASALTANAKGYFLCLCVIQKSPNKTIEYEVKCRKKDLP